MRQQAVYKGFAHFIQNKKKLHTPVFFYDCGCFAFLSRNFSVIFPHFMQSQHLLRDSCDLFVIFFSSASSSFSSFQLRLFEFAVLLSFPSLLVLWHFLVKLVFHSFQGVSLVSVMLVVIFYYFLASFRTPQDLVCLRQRAFSAESLVKCFLTIVTKDRNSKTASY